MVSAHRVPTVLLIAIILGNLLIGLRSAGSSPTVSEALALQTAPWLDVTSARHLVAAGPEALVIRPGSYRLGTIEVRGSGFMPVASVDVILYDGHSYQRGAIKATVTTTTTGYGSFVTFFKRSDLVRFGPNGSQDAAWRNTSGDMQAVPCSEDDVIRVHEPERDLWTAPIPVLC